MTPCEFAESLRCNRDIRGLKRVKLIDLTGMAVEEAAAKLVDAILDLAENTPGER